MRIPKYRLHKPSGRAVFAYKPLFGSRRIYLPGKYGSEESRNAYSDYVSRVIAHQSSPQTAPVPSRDSTVGELFAAFLDWSIEHHDKRDYDHFRAIGRIVSEADDETLVREFGPLRLKSVRQQMIAVDWSRTYINHQINRLRFVFRWGVENEWVDSLVYGNLQAVTPLRKGKTSARETETIKPVDWSAVSGLLPYLPPILKAMLELQYMTGMRSDELTCMKSAYIARGNDVWVYEPTEHKTAWRGKRKVICLGPRAQMLLTPYLTDDSQAFVFSPATALEEHAAARAKARTTKKYGKLKDRAPKRRIVLERYDHHSYQGAILHGFRQWAKAVTKARSVPKKPKGKRIDKWLSDFGIPYFHPHQLRHTRATETRASYGIEGAQAQLGNTFEAAEIYAEKSLDLAIRIARETG